MSDHKTEEPAEDLAEDREAQIALEDALTDEHRPCYVLY